ncbi:MAG: hypothetical protein VKJ85_02300 [Prochlorothrix sp.]|nr:hypothetical protein [Prochlorothrix sp.]
MPYYDKAFSTSWAKTFSIQALMLTPSRFAAKKTLRGTSIIVAGGFAACHNPDYAVDTTVEI